MPKTKTEKPISKAKKPKKKPRKKRIKKKPVTSRFFSFKGLDGVKHSLTSKQKKFVEEYLVMGGNGVDAVIAAGYDVWKRDKDGNRLYPNRKMAAVLSSQNLSKLNISAYVTKVLAEYGFDDKNVGRQHLFLLNQYGDLTNKKGAIDMYYKITGKYKPKDVNITIKNKLEDLTPAELQAVIDTGEMPNA